MEWISCPRCFRTQTSNTDSVCYTCAQGMNTWFSAMQCYFLPVHTCLAIIDALKGILGGGGGGGEERKQEDGGESFSAYVVVFFKIYSRIN